MPIFGVPEALLSDCGTNLSHLMKDVSAFVGTKMKTTTTHHPECDGMVETFNLTLKSMLRKNAAKYGKQWDPYPFGPIATLTTVLGRNNLSCVSD